MDKLKENWKLAVLITLLSVSLSTLGTLFVTSINAKDQTLHKAASVEYVDKQDSAIKSTLDVHNSRMCVLDEKIDTKADKSDVVYIRGKVDDIYNFLLAQKLANENLKLVPK